MSSRWRWCTSSTLRHQSSADIVQISLTILSVSFWTSNRRWFLSVRLSSIMLLYNNNNNNWMKMKFYITECSGGSGSSSWLQRDRSGLNGHRQVPRGSELSQMSRDRSHVTSIQTHGESPGTGPCVPLRARFQGIVCLCSEPSDGNLGNVECAERNSV